MNVIMTNALPIAALVAMIGFFYLLYDKTRFKKCWLICDVLAHVALVGFMLYADASMEELLLILLVTLVIGLV